MKQIRARLLMRELLDNQYRASTAETWYLRDFLADLIRLAKALPGWTDASDADALALVYQLLGAINYYAVSGPTLRGIFGDAMIAVLQSKFEPQLEALITAAISNRPD